MIFGLLGKKQLKRVCKPISFGLVFEGMHRKKPQMFSEQTKSKIDLAELNSLTDFKNISKGMIVYFEKAGVSSPQEVVKLGWEKTWEKLIQADYICSKPFFGHSILAALLDVHRLEITDEHKKLVSIEGQRLRDKYKKKLKKDRVKTKTIKI